MQVGLLHLCIKQVNEISLRFGFFDVEYRFERAEIHFEGLKRLFDRLFSEQLPHRFILNGDHRFEIPLEEGLQIRLRRFLWISNG